MLNLHYATTANERHAATVATWQDGDEWRYRMRLDGRVLDEGSLGPVEDTDADLPPAR